MVCDHLEGWDREGGREGDARGKRYGNICICITDSLCYKAETNTPVKSIKYIYIYIYSHHIDEEMRLRKKMCNYSNTF